MAEIYPPGDNRIFYHIRANSDSVSVRVDLLDPDLNNHTNIELTPAAGIEGLYYFDYTFREGPYIAVYFEIKNDIVVRKWSQAYSIRKESGGFRSSPGGNVINT